MKKILIKDIDNSVYTFDDGKRTYTRFINFIDSKIDIGDILYVPDNELNHNTIYTYGPIKKDADPNYSIKVVKNDTEFYLTRYFG